MITGFVLISTIPAKEHEVYDELLKIGGILELYPLFGEYDFIAKIKAEDLDEMEKIVVNKIRRVEGVADMVDTD